MKMSVKNILHVSEPLREEQRLKVKEADGQEKEGEDVRITSWVPSGHWRGNVA